MNWRKSFYNRSDRKVLLVLLCVALVIYGVVVLTEKNRQDSASISEEDARLLNSQRPAAYRYKHHYDRKFYYQDGKKAELFPFDPNTADSTELLRLGLRPWQVRCIYRYRAEGGIFRKPKDFAKLYGLTCKQYRMMEPYIRISEDFLDASTIYNYEPASARDTIKSPIKLTPQERVVLNTADTSRLKKIPGVGSHFARKIVEYRNRLGGFYDIHQLLEIEDFPESSLTYFIIPDDQVKKMNINQATLNELKAHPYITYFQAKAIIDYRRLKGNLHSLKELKLLKDFTQKAIERLEPYVEY
jgi:DNA uptake protein ComE-like DNA-binding protein